MNFFKRFSPLMLVFVFLAGTVMAQNTGNKQAQPDPVDSEELENFVAATNQAETIQQEAQKKIKTMVEEQDMEFQRFQQIMLSQQNPQAQNSVEMTEEEQETIQEIQPQMQKINQQNRQKFQSAIQENGLTLQRFQQILQAVQSNPELAQQFQKMKTEKAQMEDDDQMEEMEEENDG